MSIPTHIYTQMILRSGIATQTKTPIEAIRNGNEYILVYKNIAWTWDNDIPGGVTYAAGNFLTGDYAPKTVGVGDWVAGYQLHTGLASDGVSPLSSVSFRRAYWQDNMLPNLESIKRAFDFGGHGWMRISEEPGRGTDWIPWENS